jgi:nitrile hydratase accessory protein
VKATTLEELMRHAEVEPRDVVFQAPWEARAFAIALSLCESGNYRWDEFRRSLIAEIASDADTHESSEEYYRQFLRALENLLASKRIVDHTELTRRMSEIAATAKAAKPQV